MSGSLMLLILRRQSNITSQVACVAAAFSTKRRLQGLKFRAKKYTGIYQAAISRQKSYQASQAPKDELLSPLDPHQLAPKKKYPLVGVQYLPGSDGKGFPQFLEVPRQGLPQAYKIQHADQLSIAEWAQHSRKLLDEELTKYGAVLLRGLPLFKGEDFCLFANSLGYSPMGYEGGLGYRPVYNKDAYTFISSSEEQSHSLEVHNEMAYLPAYPRKIIFYCDVAPAEGSGGLTPIARNSEVLERLDPKIVQKLEEKEIRYHRYLPTEGKGYLPWQDTFYTDDKTEVEKFLDNKKLSYKWNEDDSLMFWYNMPATINDPITGEKVWFNQADTNHCTYYKYHASPLLQSLTFESDFHYPTHTTYGDGAEIEPEVFQHIRATKWQCSVGMQWKNKDIIVVDNVKAMHGRLSHTGDRRILVYMSSD